MKIPGKVSIFCVFMVFFISGLQAQPRPSKLNQRELIKQFIGSWNCDMGKDTSLLMTNTSSDARVIGYNKYFTNDGILREEESEWDYDINLDKFIITIVTKGTGKEVFALWFTSEKNYKRIPYSTLCNPEKVIFMVMGEILSPDVFIEKKISPGSGVNTFTFIKDSRDNRPDGSRNNPLQKDFPPEL